MLIPFNPAALFITLRESLEAVITVTVMLQFVQKTLETTQAGTTDQPFLLHRLKKHIWVGAIAGLLTALLIGSGLVFAIWVLKKDILGGAGEIWENAFELFAVVLQTYIALKFISFTNTNTSAMTAKWQRKINRHLESAAAVTTATTADTTTTATVLQPDQNQGLNLVEGEEQQQQQFRKATSKFEYPFAILAFSVVLREGMESVIYLSGISSADESPAAIALPGFIGICLSICIGVVIYKCSASIELRPLMITSVVMMLVLSAALVNEIAGEAEEYVYEQVFGIDGGSTPVLWDLSGCCSEKTVPFFQVLSALIGWKARPTVATMGTYLTYWVFIGTYIAVMKLRNRVGASFDGDSAINESTPLLQA